VGWEAAATRPVQPEVWAAYPNGTFELLSAAARAGTVPADPHIRILTLNFLPPKLPAPREEDLSRGILEAIDMDS